VNIYEDSIDWFLRELREHFKKKYIALAPPIYGYGFKVLQTFFGILIISADSRLDMADEFFFKHQKSSSNMWLEPKLDPYPFRHISWCLSKSRSSTCSVSTYIYVYIYIYIVYGVYLYIYVCTHIFLYVSTCMCAFSIWYMLMHAINNVHTWSNIYIYVYAFTYAQ
jgi:hypothetical protein